MLSVGVGLRVATLFAKAFHHLFVAWMLCWWRAGVGEVRMNMQENFTRQDLSELKTCVCVCVCVLYAHHLVSALCGLVES